MPFLRAVAALRIVHDGCEADFAGIDTDLRFAAAERFRKTESVRAHEDFSFRVRLDSGYRERPRVGPYVQAVVDDSPAPELRRWAIALVDERIDPLIDAAEIRANTDGHTAAAYVPIRALDRAGLLWAIWHSGDRGVRGARWETVDVSDQRSRSFGGLPCDCGRG